MNNTLVIAEAGPNHNQDWGLAKKLVDVATDSGADVVKFQTYSSNTLYAKQQKDVSGIKDIHSMFKSLDSYRYSGATEVEERLMIELVSLVENLEGKK